jgi:hypothetical protein
MFDFNLISFDDQQMYPSMHEDQSCHVFQVRLLLVKF